MTSADPSAWPSPSSTEQRNATCHTIAATKRDVLSTTSQEILNPYTPNQTDVKNPRKSSHERQHHKGVLGARIGRHATHLDAVGVIRLGALDMEQANAVGVVRVPLRRVVEARGGAPGVDDEVSLEQTPPGVQERQVCK